MPKRKGETAFCTHHINSSILYIVKHFFHYCIYKANRHKKKITTMKMMTTMMVMAMVKMMPVTMMTLMTITMAGVVVVVD